MFSTATILLMLASPSYPTREAASAMLARGALDWKTCYVQSYKHPDPEVRRRLRVQHYRYAAGFVKTLPAARLSDSPLWAADRLCDRLAIDAIRAVHPHTMQWLEHYDGVRFLLVPTCAPYYHGTEPYDHYADADEYALRLWATYAARHGGPGSVPMIRGVHWYATNRVSSQYLSPLRSVLSWWRLSP